MLDFPTRSPVRQGSASPPPIMQATASRPGAAARAAAGPARCNPAAAAGPRQAARATRPASQTQRRVTLPPAAKPAAVEGGTPLEQLPEPTGEWTARVPLLGETAEQMRDHLAWAHKR